MYRMVVMGLMLLLGGQRVFATPVASLLQAASLTPSAKPRAAVHFQLPDLHGQKQHLHAQRGKVVFLNFWATWCLPCRQEMPEMEQLFQSFRQQPFIMWAVAMQENRKQAASFVQEHRLHFPILLDVDGKVSAAYGLQALPTTYLIDCGGQIVGHAVGPRPWNDETVRVLLAALLEDQRCR
jgi:peroxiredoxin